MLECRYLLGMSLRETAETLAIPLGTAQCHVYRARRKLA